MLDALRAALEDVLEVRLALLFGSQVSGASTPHSDVDVGVWLELGGDHERLRLRLIEAVGREVDLIDLQAAPPLLRMEIAKTGWLLLERQPFAWADFKAKAMIDWGDWEPYASYQAEQAVRRNRERLAVAPPARVDGQP